MNPKRLRAVALLAAALTGFSGGLLAQSFESVEPQKSSADDVAALKALLAEQQKQIDQLKLTLQDQMKMLERVSASAPASAQPKQDFTLPRAKALGEVASTTPYIPAAAAVPKALAEPVSAIQGGTNTNPCEGPPDAQRCADLYPARQCLRVFRSALWMPLSCGATRTPLRRSVATSAASRTTTWSTENFPNSALARRTPALVSASTATGRAPISSATTSSTSWEPAAPPISPSPTALSCLASASTGWTRRKGKMEFLAGQSWSMLTPNRKGISPLPGDIFYSQVFDVNYMAGLTWTRQPGMRVLFHPSDKVTFGFSAENPDQYIGGYAGGSAIVLPSSFTSLSGTQLDQGNEVFCRSSAHAGLHRQDRV